VYGGEGRLSVGEILYTKFYGENRKYLALDVLRHCFFFLLEMTSYREGKVLGTEKVKASDSEFF
jgi:hypothetical protein